MDLKALYILCEVFVYCTAAENPVTCLYSTKLSVLGKGASCVTTKSSGFASYLSRSDLQSEICLAPGPEVQR